MKPTRCEILGKYHYDGTRLIYAVDSGRYGRFKTGQPAGAINNQGVRMVSLNGAQHQEHQLIWTMIYGAWPERALRHINGNLCDNRIENLTMDSLARGRRGVAVDVHRLKEVLAYDPLTGVFRWKISPRNRTLPGDVAGYLNDQGYVLCVVDQQKIRLHRAAWAMVHGELPEMKIDHINGVRSDNRIENLRLATCSQNSQNSALRSTTKTGVKGVHLRRDTGKYSASITVDKKTHWLGCYDTLSEAKAARLEWESKFHPFSASARIY